MEWSQHAPIITSARMEEETEQVSKLVENYKKIRDISSQMSELVKAITRLASEGKPGNQCRSFIETGGRSLAAVMYMRSRKFMAFNRAVRQALMEKEQESLKSGSSIGSDEEFNELVELFVLGLIPEAGNCGESARLVYLMLKNLAPLAEVGIDTARELEHTTVDHCIAAYTLQEEEGQSCSYVIDTWSGRIDLKMNDYLRGDNPYKINFEYPNRAVGDIFWTKNVCGPGIKSLFTTAPTGEQRAEKWEYVITWSKKYGDECKELLKNEVEEAFNHERLRLRNGQEVQLKQLCNWLFGLEGEGVIAAQLRALIPGMN